MFITDEPDVDFEELNEGEAESMDFKKDHPRANLADLADLVPGDEVHYADFSTVKAY